MSALPKKNRLTDRKIISQVMRRGTKLTAKGLKVYVGGPAIGPWRTTVIAPKKIDKRATVRNRLRRRVGEIIRRSARFSIGQSNIVVYLEPGSAELSFAELKKELGALLDRPPK